MAVGRALPCACAATNVICLVHSLSAFPSPRSSWEDTMSPLSDVTRTSVPARTRTRTRFVPVLTATSRSHLDTDTVNVAAPVASGTKTREGLTESGACVGPIEKSSNWHVRPEHDSPTPPDAM